MKKLTTALFAVFAAAGLAACDGGGDASCATCGQSYSDTQCMAIAQSHGCTSGMSSPDNMCTEPTRGCVFQGCPAGPVMCMVNTDTGATDATTDTGATE